MQASWQDPPEYRDPGPSGTQFAMPSLTPMVKRLMIANAAVFLVSFLLFLIAPGIWSGTYGLANLLGIRPSLWIDWFPLAPVWQLVTWGFLHSVTMPTHILFNMLGLYFFGTMVEGIVGGRRFLTLYGAALLIAGVATLAVGLLTYPGATTLGASGAVLAVIVAAATMRPHAQVIFLIFPMTLRTLAIVIVGIDLFYFLLQLSGQGGDGVARLAHLTGAAWGFLAVRRGWIWRDPLETVERWSDVREERREVEDDQEVDRLLAKIHREGIGSLSASERARLKRASKRR